MALKDITDKVAPVWQALKGIATGSKIISTEWNTVIENVAERTQFLRRRGVCDWDSTLSYSVGDYVQVSGVVYKSLAANANKAPTSNPTIWETCYLTKAEVKSAVDLLGYAPLASPALTGTPTAPTAADGTNTTQIASTAFVQSAVGGYLSKSITGGTVTLTDAEASNPVIGISGTLTSNATIVLPATVKRLWAIYNATSGAYTVTVKLASGTGVTVAQGKRNLVYTDGTNVYDGFNDFDNIALTGVSTAPTAAVDTSTTQVATTAFVTSQAASTAPIANGTAAVGSSKRYARADHVHPTDTTLATVANFANSKAANGWQKLEGGLIIQWGTVGLAANNSTAVQATVAFPIAFPSACVHISGVQTSRASSEGGGTWAMRPTNKTKANFLATLDNNGGNTSYNFTLAQTAEWIAIGY